MLNQEEPMRGKQDKGNYKAKSYSLWALVLLWVVFDSCRKQVTVYQGGDQYVRVALAKVSSKSDEDAYKLRVSIIKKAAIDSLQSAKEAMLYRMDSCLYEQIGGQKQYPTMIQPVANGLSGVYDYLIVLGHDIDDGEKQPALYYQDKYLTKKLYRLSKE